MSEVKDTVLLIGGLTIGGLLLKEILFAKPNEEEQKLIDEINEHIKNSVDESNLALEDLESADECYTKLQEKDTLTNEDWELCGEWLDKVKHHIENSVSEDEQALDKSKELSEMLGDESYYEQVREIVIKKGIEFIKQVGPYVVTVTLFISIFKGRHILANLFLKRKGGGGNPEAPIPEVKVIPYEIINPVTKVPDNITDDYNPIADPNPISGALPLYEDFPIETPIELIYLTPHEQKTLDKWKEIWSVIELLDIESKQLLYERLPSPMNEAIYYSWDEIPLAFGVLFNSPLVRATSWHEVSRKGEFGRFAVACGIILSAAIIVAALIAIGLISTSVSVPAAIAAAIVALGAGVGAIAA